MYRSILVPLDGTAEAETALPHVTAIASRFGASVILVRVVSPVLVAPIPTFAGPELIARDHPGDAEMAQAYLDQQAASLAAAGVPATVEVRCGTPSDELVQCIEERQPDLVVMTTRAGITLTGLLLGSTAESVLARSTVPLLLVRAEPAARAGRTSADSSATQPDAGQST